MSVSSLQDGNQHFSFKEFIVVCMFTVEQVDVEFMFIFCSVYVDHSRGFGGKYGVEKDRQDLVCHGTL